MAASTGRSYPRGGPRGLLLYWMLHRISDSPAYGYQILTEIDAKTNGGWKPGPGSVYPLLKRLVEQGYAKGELVRGTNLGKKRYSITPEGARHLTEARKVFKTATQRWGSLRSIYVDLIEPTELGPFLLEGSRRQFEIARDLLSPNRDQLSRAEVGKVLREYAFSLEGQLGWTNQMLNNFGSGKHPRPRTR